MGRPPPEVVLPLEGFLPVEVLLPPDVGLPERDEPRAVSRRSQVVCQRQLIQPSSPSTTSPSTARINPNTGMIATPVKTAAASSGMTAIQQKGSMLPKNVGLRSALLGSRANGVLAFQRVGVSGDYRRFPRARRPQGCRRAFTSR